MSQTLSTAALLAVPLAPLAGCLAAGILGTTFGGNVIGRRASHTATILGVLDGVALPAAMRGQRVQSGQALAGVGEAGARGGGRSLHPGVQADVRLGLGQGGQPQGAVQVVQPVARLRVGQGHDLQWVVFEVDHSSQRA